MALNDRLIELEGRLADLERRIAAEEALTLGYSARAEQLYRQRDRLDGLISYQRDRIDHSIAREERDNPYGNSLLMYFEFGFAFSLSDSPFYVIVLFLALWNSLCVVLLLLSMFMSRLPT
jgi:hypothetical protein